VVTWEFRIMHGLAWTYTICFIIICISEEMKLWYNRFFIEKAAMCIPWYRLLCSWSRLPLQANGTVDILEVTKSAVRTFDQRTIFLGSTRSYKSSNHLLVNCETNVKFPGRGRVHMMLIEYNVQLPTSYVSRSFKRLFY